jgi:16S rRNA (cytidine1402-2'-O)-methyltransferase
METGQLLVCATPIGNLGDVTLRVLDALRDADVVAAEDTRVTRKLFARYEIDTTLLTYHVRLLLRRVPPAQTG